MKGNVFAIERCSLHDGPGIRTTVFLKGCPLRCLWCHNPESMRFEPEIRFTAVKCTGCGKCAAACEAGCHRTDSGKHRFDRADCVRCGRCTEACPSGALEFAGREMTVDEVISTVLRDRAFFENSGGGMTLSGGEPLAQPDFARALLAAARAEGLHTCLDTSGGVAYEHLAAVAELVDLFLYDIKETDPARHAEFTGRDNRLILENLRRLDAGGAVTSLRCPIVPGYNDREDHLAALGELAESLEHVLEVQVMPFHPYGSHKSSQIGAQYALSDISAPDRETVDRWRSRIAARTSVPVK